MGRSLHGKVYFHLVLLFNLKSLMNNREKTSSNFLFDATLGGLILLPLQKCLISMSVG